MSCASLPPDISNLTPAELQGLIDAANARKQEIAATHRADTRAKLMADAKSAGYDLYELFGIPNKSKPAKPRASTSGKSNLPAKYADPRDPSVTWVGRGKRPRWVSDYVNGGGQLSDLAIKVAA